MNSYPIVHCIRVESSAVLRVLEVSAIREAEESFPILARHLVDFPLYERISLIMVFKNLVRDDNQGLFRHDDFSRKQFP